MLKIAAAQLSLNAVAGAKHVAPRENTISKHRDVTLTLTVQILRERRIAVTAQPGVAQHQQF